MSERGSARDGARTSRGFRHSRLEPRAPMAIVLLAALLASGGLLSDSLLGVARAADDEPTEDVRFADGLRSRRLFDLGIAFCRKRLQASDLPAVERTLLVIELLKTQTAQALNATPRERPALWKAAAETLNRFLAQHGKSPRVLLVRMQAALGALAQGELARQEAEVGSTRQRSLEAARGQIRRAIRQFEQLDKEITRELPLRRRRRLLPDELTPDELFALQNTVRLQWARALRNQALCYPKGGDDYLAALSLALQRLGDALRQLPADDRLTWRVRMEQLVCLRLREDYAQAQRLLAALRQPEAPAGIQAQAAAEAARLQLAAGKPEAAWQLLEGTSVTHPELDYARLEALLARLRSAPQQQAADLRKQALAWVARIEDRHGPYWGRRASQFLVSQAGGSANAGGAGMEILRRTAETLYLKGQLPEALEAYDKAFRHAVAQGAEDAAFSLGFAAALIERKRRMPQAHLDRLRKLSLALPAHPRASAAHQAAIAQCVALARTDRAALKLYEQLLLEHLEHWPGAETADQVRLWIGRLRRSQRKWREAIAAYSAVSADSPQFPAAVRAAESCWSTQLEALRATGAATELPADRAAAFFESIVFDNAGRLPARWTALQRDAALWAARIRIRFRTRDFPQVERLLSAALAAPAPADNRPAYQAWQRRAQALLVAALAGQPGKTAAAQQLLTQLGGAQVGDLLPVLGSLERVAATAPASVRRTLAQLQLQAIRLTENQAGLTSQDRQRLETARAAALRAAGRSAEALSAFEKLARQFPRSGAIQRGLAELLSSDPQRARQAINQWRIVAKRSKPRTPAWFEAKYQLAALLTRQPDAASRSAARDMIRYLQATTDMRTPRKAAFEALLRKLK